MLARNWVVAMALLGPLLAPPVHADERLLGNDLPDLLQYARQHNPDYAATLQEADAVSARVQPAGALPDPKITFELRDLSKMGQQSPSLLPNKVGSTRYLISQEVPWFGKRELRQEIAQIDAEGATDRARGAWLELATRIKSTYAQLYAAQRNESLSEEILGLLAQLETLARSRYASGLAAQPDAIRAQLEQSAMRNELLTQQTLIRQLQARLNTLLARPANAPLAKPRDAGAAPLLSGLRGQDLEARVQAGNPQIFAEDARLRAAQKTRELTYKNRYPDVNVGVAPIQYGSAIREWEIMLEVSIPLQQRTRRSQEAEASAMVGAAQSRKEAATQQALGALHENLAMLESLQATSALVASTLLPQARVNFDSALAGYEQGKVDFATVIEAQRQIRLTQQSQLKAQTDLAVQWAELEKLLGEAL